MDVPATRPEVTTTGIYGEELGHIRQRLLGSDLAWCGDLTSRTQILIVGRVTPTGSRKLAVARERRLPCVVPAWVTDGGSSLESADAFDVCHELTRREVCTTSMSPQERRQVQTICAARNATYNPALVRHCDVLVAPAAMLTLTSSSETKSDKLRFARRHGIRTLALEDFVLRYGVDSFSGERVGVGSSNAPRASHAVGREALQHPSSTRSASVLQSSSHATYVQRNERHMEVNAEGALRDASRHSTHPNTRGTSDVLVRGSARGNATSLRPSTATTTTVTTTPQPSTVAPLPDSSRAPVTPAPSSTMVESAWEGSAPSIMRMSTVPPSQFTQLTTSALSAAPSQSPRFLGDELSDVVAYCSPPHCLSTEQHDLLSALGVTLIPKLTPGTTHVLLLGDTAEECLFPRPGLQIVSWRWVTQCVLQQRRLSCASFRVALQFCPTLTFTGLASSDRQELVTALRRCGLACEVQEALVLGRSGGRAGDAPHHSTTARSASGGPAALLPSPSSLPRPTTHLVCVRHQLLASQKVAMLSQYCSPHARRGSRSPVISTPPSASSCRLVGADWVYRSIQCGQWLDPDLFALSLPHPEAFALAAAAASRASAAVKEEEAPPHRSQSHGPLSSSGEVRLAPSPPPSSSSSVTASGPALASDVSVLAPSAAAAPPVEMPVGRREVAAGRREARGEVEEEEEEEEGAALSQHRNSTVGALSVPASGPGAAPHLTPPPAFTPQRDDDDEEAGGESPSATAARHSALQALHTSQPPPPPTPPALSPPSPRTSQAERLSPATPSSSSDKAHASRGATTPPDHLAPSASPAVPADASHTYCNTQYSPALENLLGELEAYPSEVLGGGLPFSSMPAPPPRAPPVASTLAGQISTLAEAQDFDSFVHTPLSSAEAVVRQTSTMQRRRLLQQAGPPSLALGKDRSVSDESQVIFYQLDVADSSSSVDPAPPSSGVAPPVSEPDWCGAVAATIDAEEPSHDEGVQPARSAITAPVFFVEKKGLTNGEVDWDAFRTLFPQCRLTDKAELCTHFVTSCPIKSESMLCTIALGRWVVTPAYLTACREAGYLVREDKYEWTEETVFAGKCSSAALSLAQGCHLRRKTKVPPFVGWRVYLCCTSVSRAESFMRVLRCGGCTTVRAVTASEVLEAGCSATLATRKKEENDFRPTVVLADEEVFTEAELEEYQRRAAMFSLCPIKPLNYLVRAMCAPDASSSGSDMLHVVRAHKRSRSETPPPT